MSAARNAEFQKSILELELAGVAADKQSRKVHEYLRVLGWLWTFGAILGATWIALAVAELRSWPRSAISNAHPVFG